MSFCVNLKTMNRLHRCKNRHSHSNSISVTHVLWCFNFITNCGLPAKQTQPTTTRTKTCDTETQTEPTDQQCKGTEHHLNANNILARQINDKTTNKMQRANVSFQKNKFTESFPFLVSRWPTAYPDHTDTSKERSSSWRLSATHILPDVMTTNNKQQQQRYTGGTLNNTDLSLANVVCGRCWNHSEGNNHLFHVPLPSRSFLFSCPPAALGPFHIYMSSRMHAIT